MESNFTTATDVIVVDPQLRDYEELIVGASQLKIRVRLLTCGEEAIRFSRSLFDGLWLINTQLPEMTGLDLLRIIRERNPDATVFLVSDTHNQEDEMAARSAGATAYVCKPPHASWLKNARPEVRARPFRQALARASLAPSAEYC